MERQLQVSGWKELNAVKYRFFVGWSFFQNTGRDRVWINNLTRVVKSHKFKKLDYATRTIPGQGGYPRTFPSTISRVPYDRTSLFDDFAPFLLISLVMDEVARSQAMRELTASVFFCWFKARNHEIRWIFRVTLAFPRRPVHKLSTSHLFPRLRLLHLNRKLVQRSQVAAIACQSFGVKVKRSICWHT
jgi:hypothetical protein